MPFLISYNNPYEFKEDINATSKKTYIKYINVSINSIQHHLRMMKSPANVSKK